MQPIEQHSTAPEHINAGTNWPAGEKLYTETFENPHEYLATLRSNFTDLARSSGTLNLQSLTIDADDTSLSPKARAAAQVTAAHFDEFLAINHHDNGSGMGGIITRDDVNHLMDMADHNVKTTVEKAKHFDRVDVATSTSMITLPMIGAGLLVAGSGIAGAMAIPIAGAAIGIGMAAHAGSKIAKEQLRIDKTATNDEAIVRSWLK